MISQRLQFLQIFKIEFKKKKKKIKIIYISIGIDIRLKGPEKTISRPLINYKIFYFLNLFLSSNTKIE